MTRFNVSAMLVGDGYFSPFNQRMSMWKVPYALNVLEQENMN